MPITFGVFYLEGLQGRKNWVYYRPALKSSKKTIIFFPGDISDFFYNSLNLINYNSNVNPDKDNFYSCSHYPYSLEGLAWLLSMRFQDQSIILIRPCIVNCHCACYLNFFPCDEFGTPRSLELINQMYGSSDPDIKKSNSNDCNYAALHLRYLLNNLISSITIEKTEENIFNNITLVGFSKGSTVLTSLLQDLNKLELNFASSIESFHFLDPGLSEKSLLFDLPKQSPLFLNHIKNPNIKYIDKNTEYIPTFSISLHGTPRQLNDPLRAHINKEIEEFYNKVKRSDIKINRITYYKKEKPTLNMHFEIIKDFCLDLNLITNKNDNIISIYNTFDKAPNPIRFFENWGNSSVMN